MVDHDNERSRPGAGTGSSARGDARTGSGMTEQAKHYAEDMAGRAKEQGRSMFDKQKETAARQVETVAGAIRNTAGHLDGEGESQVGRYVGQAAERLESFSRQLRDKDLDGLISEAENLGRRSPGALFAGSLVAGFALARFLKSSSERRHETERSSRMGQHSDGSAHRDYPIAESEALSSTRTSASSSMRGDSGVHERVRVPAGASGSSGTSGVAGIAGAGVSGSTTGSTAGMTGTSGSTGAGTTGSAASGTTGSTSGNSAGNTAAGLGSSSTSTAKPSSSTPGSNTAGGSHGNR